CKDISIITNFSSTYRFQILLYFICAYQNISCDIHYLTSVFMSITPEHTCKPTGLVKQAISHNYSTWKLEDILALLSPGQKDHITVKLQDSETWELSRCSRIWRENTSHFDYDKWKSSMVSRWNLVCEQKWYAKAIQPIFMLGNLLGAIIFGCLSDRLGRQLILWSTSIGMFLSGVSSALMFDYFSFMASRFLLAMAVSGYLVVVFVYVMEFIGMKSRTWASIHMHTFFGIRTKLVALVSYFIRTWWLYQMTFSTATVPFILCCWMYKEAQRVVDTMAVWNKANSCNLSELLSLDANDPDGNSRTSVKHSLVNLFYDRSVTIRTIILWLIWLTGSLGFYTFTLDTLNIGKHEFLLYFLLSVMDIPAYFFVCVGSIWVGRRITLAFSLFFVSLTCGVVERLPTKHKALISLAVKFAIVSVFGLVYLYTGELYPTIIRLTAVGSGNVVSPVASIIIPFSMELTQIWVFLPQSLVGVLAFLSGLLSLTLPETRGKLLATTWKDMVPENNSSSNKLLPIANNIKLEKLEVVDLEDCGGAERAV
uniref:Solute carrier family 22 member 16 n=1 Tax=Castor canadensis TaxID=51338 RepID=A0A8C0X570_CASCN